MRGKVAKALRKAAERITVKLPGRRLGRMPNGTLLNMNCTRAIYLKMKKERKK